jgi:hypothetical protein
MGGKIGLMSLLLVVTLCLSACSRDKEQAKQDIPAKPASAAKVQQEPPPPPPEILPVAGKVLEILDTGSFVYLLIDWNGKKVWATVPGVDLKVGETVSLDHAAMFKGFHSNALNRDFDELIFASSVIGKSPRNRVAKSVNPNDPGGRRSGKIPLSPLPAPPRPTGKAGQ